MMTGLRAATRWLKYVVPVVRLSRRAHARIFVQDFRSMSGVAVRRDTFLLDLCRGKRVLHFGFLDAPFSEEKLRSGALLHSGIAKHAAYLYGVDIDEESLAAYRAATNDANNGILDIQDVACADTLGQRFDVLLFPEILEHLRNPGKALDNLRTIAERNPGCVICVTVPNAFSLKSIAGALDGVELVHPDHYAYFSPHTLRRLLASSGFTDIEQRFYWFELPCGGTVGGLLQEGLIALCRTGQT